MFSPLVALVCIPKPGALMLVGGGPTTDAMVRDFVDLCGGNKREIVILAQAYPDPSSASQTMGRLSSNAFDSVSLILSSSFTEEEKSELEERLSRAAGIWVPGEDQSLFVKRFGLAWCQRVFPRLIKNGVNWFGTGAGASLVGSPMFTGQTVSEGIGIIDGLVDTHYFSQHRELRLRKAFFGCRVQYGFGLDEGEYVILRDNLIEKKVGSPQVFLRE